MKNVVALINLYETPELGLLTEKRPVASTTFLGRYAFVDFQLSNLTNSGIDNVGIMVKDNSRSIIKHIRSENSYLKNAKTGYFTWMINEKGLHNPFFNTDINNISENDYFLYDEASKYVLIVPVGFILKVDYTKLIEDHIKSGKDISACYCEVENAGEDFFGLNKFTVNALGNIQKVEPVDPKDKKAYVSLQTYIFNRDTLRQALGSVKNLSNVFSIKDLITYIQKYGNVQIHAVRYEGQVDYVNSLKKYYEISFKYKDKMLTEREEFFAPNWKIFTRTHDTRPILYGPSCRVVNSVLANGCTIQGTVKNSILARNVIVEEGATVEDSIIFSDCVIKKGVHLKNVVSDKLCVFKNKDEVFGTKEEVVYIPQGENI